MILSQGRMNELLQIFNESPSVTPYDITHQKEEVENASKFIKDYHLYGPPKKYQTHEPIIKPIPAKEQISPNESINSQNEANNKQSTILTNNIHNLQNYEDIEIYQSITNLKNGQKNYINDKEKKYSEYTKSINLKNSFYPTYNPQSQSIYAYEYQKNENILNNILANKSTFLNSNHNNYNHNNYNTYNDYQSIYNNNSSLIKAYKSKKLPNLKDIPSNPDDVIITEIPSDLAISLNPRSSTNLGVMPSVPTNFPENNINNNIIQSPNEFESKPQIIEEINTDLIQNEEINQSKNQIKEEPILLDNLEPVQEPEQEKVGKYKITEFGGPVTLPPNYSTDDEDEFNAIQILNQNKSDWKLQKDKDNIKIYSKLFKIFNDEGKEVDNIVFFTEATIDFPASEVNKQMHNYTLRSKWEKSLQKGKIIKEERLPNDIDICDYYAYVKMPFIFADRDMVLRSKTWCNYLGEKDCYLTHLKSIEHPDFPPKEKPVRAIYENAGQYIKPISDNQCKLYSIAKFDFKISAPVSMMEGKGSDGQFKGIKEFISHCGK